MEYIKLFLILGLVLLVGCNVKGIDRGQSKHLWGDELDMANTIDPILYAVCGQVCPFPSDDGTSFLLSGDLIYKREKVNGCINPTGNIYYCRCYRWDWVDKEDEKCLVYKAIEDIPLKEIFNRTVNSCFDEKDLLIPYYNKELAEMKIGETKEIQCNKKNKKDIGFATIETYYR